jgi:uncharacterized protein
MKHCSKHARFATARKHLLKPCKKLSAMLHSGTRCFHAQPFTLALLIKLAFAGFATSRYAYDMHMNSTTLIKSIARTSLLLCALSASLLTVTHAQANKSLREQEVLLGYPAYVRGDYADAERDFRAAAKDNVRAAQYNLAVMIMRGETKREPDKSDYDEAIAWLRKSAALKFTESQYALGKLYEQGELLPRDLMKALEWYKLAAEQGHIDAQLELVAGYMLGRGTIKSPELAASWAAKAADAGDAGAQYLIASFYEKGDGVPMDLQKAMDWYVQAARNGDDAAPLKAKELAAKLKP